nr:MAG TPA: hypothetical protein [Caudoviricetes sp.]
MRFILPVIRKRLKTAKNGFKMLYSGFMLYSN